MKSSLYFFLIVIFAVILYSLAGVEGICAVKAPKASTLSKVDSFSVAVEEDDLLTVDIRDAVLGEVLQQLSDKHGIIFSMPPSLAQDKLMVRFTRVKMDEGLNKLLASYNRIFIYSNTGDEISDSDVLTEVRLFPRFQESAKKMKEKPLVIRPGVSLPSFVSKEVREEPSRGAPVKRSSQEKLATIRLEDYGKALADKNNPKRRVDAVKTLRWVGDEQVLGTLAKVWDDKDPRVKNEAQKALGEIGESLKEESKGDMQEEVNDPEDVMPPSEQEAYLSLTAGSAGVNLDLDNGVPIRALQFTLNGAKMSDVRTTPRSEGFFAKYNEKNGMVTMMSLTGQKIAPGSGPIAEIVCSNPNANITNVKMTK